MAPASWRPARLDLAEPAYVLDVERAVHGTSEPADPAFFDWYYRCNPAGEGIIWYAPTDDPEVPSAGHYAVVPVRMSLRGRPLLGSVSVNTLTHPRFRRMGVSSALVARVFEECRRTGIALSCGFPNPVGYPFFIQSAGYADIGRVPLLLAPLRAAALRLPGRSARWQWFVRAAAPLATSASAAIRATLARSDVAIERVPASWDGWDVLWKRLDGRHAVMLVRDSRYMTWRYGECPTRQYTVYVALCDGEPGGFLVTRTATILGLDTGLIVDFIVDPRWVARRIGEALVVRATRDLAAAGAEVAVALMLERRPEYTALRRAGFFRCPPWLEPQPFTFVLKRHDDAIAAEIPTAIGEWFLTQGDYDVA